MSMYYTKILSLLLIILLSGCSQNSRIDSDSKSKTDVTTQSDNEMELQLYQKAITHLNDNELDKAEEILLTFSNKHPDLAGPIANLGLIQLKRNNIDQAEVLLNQALARNPKLPQALNLLGVVQQKKGNIKQAEELYIKATQEKENYAIAHYNLALLYDIFLGKISKAIIHYQKYLALIDYPDKQTSNWLKELQYTMESNNS